jgi:hypothetical protein
VQDVPVAVPVVPAGTLKQQQELAMAIGPHGKKRTALPTLKLAQFEGNRPLETFLAKFDNCSYYYEWSDGERRLDHLRASLDDEAAQVLCDLDRWVTFEDLVQMLKKRLGNNDQRVRFRSEL